MSTENYNYDEQQPFASAEFAENPEPRCPCVLLLDTSTSMEGNSIAELNAGLRTFRDELFDDSLCMKRVEIAMITFGPVKLVQDFTTVDGFRLPELHANGNTPMGEAVSYGLKALDNRKQILRSNGIKLFRPWIFLMTDGEPTDEWKHVASKIHGGEEKKSFSFFPLAVDGANLEVLSELSLREPMRLKGVKFREFFLWLSASLKNVSRSNPGDKVSLPDYKPYGWADV